MVRLDLVTDYATTNLVSLSEAKQHLRIGATYDDTNVRTLLDTARQLVETQTNRSVLNQKWKMYLDYFPSEIHLPQGFVSSVQAVKYTNTSNVETTLTAGTDYNVAVNCENARITAPSTGWPSDLNQDIRKPVTVEFTAGYGEVRGQKTSWAEAATLLMLSKLYYNMESLPALERLIALNTYYTTAYYDNLKRQSIQLR